MPSARRAPPHHGPAAESSRRVPTTADHSSTAARAAAAAIRSPGAAAAAIAAGLPSRWRQVATKTAAPSAPSPGSSQRATGPVPVLAPLRRSAPATSGAAGHGSRPCTGSPTWVATRTWPSGTVVPGATISRAVARLFVPLSRPAVLSPRWLACCPLRALPSFPAAGHRRVREGPRFRLSPHNGTSIKQARCLGRQEPAPSALVVAPALLLGEEPLELRAELLRGRHVLAVGQQAVPAGDERVVLLLQCRDNLRDLGRPLDLPGDLQVGPPGRLAQRVGRERQPRRPLDRLQQGHRGRRVG